MKERDDEFTSTLSKINSRIIKDAIGEELASTMQNTRDYVNRENKTQTSEILQHVQRLINLHIRISATDEINRLREIIKQQHQLILEVDMKVHRLTKELAAKQ